MGKTNPDRTICFTAHCSHCGAAIFVRDVPPGGTINTRCPLCDTFQPITAPVSQSRTGTQYQAKNYAAPAKKKPVLKWLLFPLASAVICVAAMAVGIPVEAAMPVYCIISGFCLIMAAINAIVNISRKNGNGAAPMNPTWKKTAKQAAAASKSPPRQGAPQTGSYDKRGKPMASKEFQKLEGYLLDAEQILRHAEDMGYENRPLIILRDTGSGGSSGYLCFETKIFHRPGVMEYNPPASDIEKVKAGMAAHAFSPENPYSRLEKQFVADVYGAGYACKGGMPLCYDPDDCRWDAGENCYVFGRTLANEFSTAYDNNRGARRRLIKAAARYWKKNNMSRGMLFSGI